MTLLPQSTYLGPNPHVSGIRWQCERGRDCACAHMSEAPTPGACRYVRRINTNAQDNHSPQGNVAEAG